MTIVHSKGLRKMSSKLSTLIESEGPGLSSKFLTILRNQGLSADAARKHLERSKKDYISLKGLKFTKNTKFIFLPYQFDTPMFWHNLEQALREGGMSYWSALQVLKAHGGIVPRKLFRRIAGTPEKRISQVPPDTILERMVAIRILRIEKQNDKEYVICNEALYQPIDKLDSNFQCSPNSLLRAKELSEEMILDKMKKLIRNLGMCSYHKVAVRYDSAIPPVVAGITWDLTAPSYLRPFRTYRDEELLGGYIVCDINLSRDITNVEAEAFIRKCKLADSPPRMRPILPMFVGTNFENDAFDILKENGMMPITVGGLFGVEATKMLQEIKELITDLGNKVANYPEALSTVLQQVRQELGSQSNAFGYLFEQVVAHMVHSVEGGYLKTNMKVQDISSSRWSELDVVLDKSEDGEILVIECKAKDKGGLIDSKVIERWIEDRVPLIYNGLRSSNQNRKFRFELWTNGRLSSSDRAMLESRSKELHSYKVYWKDMDELREYSRNKKIEKSFRDILKQCYFG